MLSNFHFRHFRRVITVGSIGAGLAIAATSMPAVAQTQPSTEQPKMSSSERTVSVSATGQAAAIPDRAAISTGVLTEAATARDAMSLSTTAMTKLIDGLKAAGIDAKDIRTTTVNVSARYTQPRDGKPAVINGYQAQNQVRITVRDLKRLGDILDASLTLGATQMNGIAFEVSAAETLKDEARKAAMVNARRRAELYAAATGATLGQVLAISEDAIDSGPQPGVFRTRAIAAQPVPVEPGAQQLDATVHVTWSLK